MKQKTPLLLVPGLLCDEALWSNQLSGLSDIADCTVTDMRHDDTISGMAKRILDNAPDRFALCGLSMGGYCSLEIMRQAPDRVEKLALLDTSARPDNTEKQETRRRLMEWTRQGKFDAVLKALLPFFIHPMRMTEGNFKSIIEDSANNIGPDVFLNQQKAIMSRIDSRDSLSSITCPTLVMCGDQDELTPPELHREMADAITNSELVIVEDCGHLSPLERPDVATPALRNWLLS